MRNEYVTGDLNKNGGKNKNNSSRNGFNRTYTKLYGAKNNS